MAVSPVISTLLFDQFPQNNKSRFTPDSSSDLTSTSSSGPEYKHTSCPESFSSGSSSSSSPEITRNPRFLSMFDQHSTVSATKIKRKRKTTRLAKLNTASSSHSIRNSAPIKSANDIELTSCSLFPSIDADQFNPSSQYYIPLTASIAGPTMVRND